MGSVNEAIPEPRMKNHNDESDTDDPELEFGNLEDDWMDEENSEEDVEEEDDELLLAMDDMYGSVEYSHCN